MKPNYISAEEVNSVLSWPLVNNAVEAALKAVSSDKPDACNQPARTFTFSEDRKGVLLNMPAFLGNYHFNEGRYSSSTLACKLVTSFSGNSNLEKPLPSILANILLFNHKTGQLETILDGTEITSWRTASASVVSTYYLYFKKEGIDEYKSINLGIFGCGVQGRYHSLAFCSTFDVQVLRLWNRSPEKAQVLADELEKLKSTFVNKNTKIIVCSDVSECSKNSDVIVTGTYAKEPFLSLSMVKENVHINAVGAGETHHGELSQDLYDVAKVYVDHTAGANVELKSLKAEIVGEVGTVINKENYPNAGITVFQSMGMAAEDATVAQAVVDALKRQKKM